MRLEFCQPTRHWRHPLMMAIVVFVMGSFVGMAGWRGRIAKEKAIANKSLSAHRTLAPWMFFFMAAGYTLTITHKYGFY